MVINSGLVGGRIKLRTLLQEETALLNREEKANSLSMKVIFKMTVGTHPLTLITLSVCC